MIRYTGYAQVFTPDGDLVGDVDADIWEQRSGDDDPIRGWRGTLRWLQVDDLPDVHAGERFSLHLPDGRAGRFSVSVTYDRFSAAGGQFRRTFEIRGMKPSPFGE